HARPAAAGEDRAPRARPDLRRRSRDRERGAHDRLARGDEADRRCARLAARQVPGALVRNPRDLRDRASVDLAPLDDDRASRAPLPPGSDRLTRPRRTSDTPERGPERMAKSILELIRERESEKFDLHERHLNTQLVRVLKTIGFDRHYVRASGPYLYDERG